jgi:uncharacterized protein (TIGR00645 family)
MIKKIIQFPIFESRWILVIFYCGLILSQFIFCIKFLEDVWHLLTTFSHVDSEEVMIAVLHLLDVAMIANLIKMVVTGSYQSFIEKVSGDSGEKASSGLLKVKMATSLCVVAGINLLPVFLKPTHIETHELIMKLILMGSFIILSLSLAVIEYLHVKGHDNSHVSHAEPVKTQPTETHKH